MKFNLLNIIFSIALIALVAMNIKTCGKLSDIEQINFAKEDTLQTIKNKHGQYESTIAIMNGTVADLKKLNAGKDSAILKLQKMVDRHTISATVHGTVTGNTVISNSVITNYDTVLKNDSIKIYPVYQTQFKNKWENFHITATKDSIKIKYKVFNEFDYVVRDNRVKWYKQRVPQITVTNINPNTETLELKSFSVKAPKGQKILLFSGGAIVGSISTIAIIKIATGLIK